MVNRLCGTADEPALKRWQDLSHLLSELYTQLQRQRQVTVHRIEGGKDETKAHAGKKASPR